MSKPVLQQTINFQRNFFLFHTLWFKLKACDACFLLITINLHYFEKNGERLFFSKVILGTKLAGAELELIFSELLYTSELPGAPTTLQLFNNNGGDDGDQVSDSAGFFYRTLNPPPPLSQFFI